jgi:hypothetical protein
MLNDEQKQKINKEINKWDKKNHEHNDISDYIYGRINGLVWCKNNL